MNVKRITVSLAPVLAGIAAGGLFLLFYAVYGFYPFGSRSVAWCDLEQQGLPLLMELKTAFSGDGSLFLGKGGGLMSFYGVFLFFLSSPLSLITLAVDNSHIIYFINIFIMIKAALAAASAELYFRKLFPKLPVAFGVLMSVMYAVSGYVMMYFQNQMWLDMMIIFPLLMLSMFRLIEKGKWGAYTVCTAMCLVLNFYISFMIILMLMMFGGAALYLCCGEKDRPDRAFRLIAGDLCAALLSAAVWLPAFLQYTSSGRGSSAGSLFFGDGFLYNTLDKTVLLSGSCLVFAAIALIIVYRKRLNEGKNGFFALSAVITLAGAFIEPANKLIQTGSYQAYPLRYGFIIILLGFSACAGLLSERAGTRSSGASYAVTGAAALLLAAVSAAACLQRSRLSSYARTLWVEKGDGLILTAVGLTGALAYFLCLRNYREGRINRGFSVFIMAAALLCESFLGFGVHVSETYDPVQRFERTYDAFSRLPDEGFFRVKSGKKYYYPNYAEAFGAYSIGHYTSLTDCDFLYASKRLGYSSHWLDMTSAGGTSVTDAFLLNRYVIGSPSGQNKLYEVFDDRGYFTVYADPNVPEGAIVSQVSPEELADFESFERMAATCFIAKRLFGEAGIAEELEPYSAENLVIMEKNGRIYAEIPDKDKPARLYYSTFVNERRELYFDIFGNYSTNVSEDCYGAADIWVNGRRLEKDYPAGNNNGILDLGTFENQQLSVKVDILQDFDATSFGLYLLDADRAAAASASAEAAPLEVCGDTVSVTARGGGYLYLPVAYSEGWSCTVNGEAAPAVRVLGAFTAVALPEGEARVELRFCTPGLKAGAALTAAGAAVAAGLSLFLKRKSPPRRLRRAAERLLCGLSAVTAALIYLAAPLVWTAVNIISRIFGG